MIEDQAANDATFSKKSVKAILIIILMVSMLVLSTRLTTFIHEVFGHALVAYLFDFSIHKIDISLFGGGYVSSDFHSKSILKNILFSYSGILINILTAIIIFIYFKKVKIQNIFISLFLSLTLLASLNGGIAYIILGIYYEYGDPVTWTSILPAWYTWCWLPTLCFTPFSSYLSTRVYLTIQEKIISTTTGMNRLKTTLITLGIPIIIYVLLFFTFNQHTVSTDAAQQYHSREKEKITIRKIKEVEEKIKLSKPNITKKQIKEELKNTSIIVAEKEIPTKFPLIIILIFLYFTGGLISIFKFQPSSNLNKTGQGDFNGIFKYILLAIAVLVLLYSTHGQIYPFNF
ncbi:MAG: hypothetical protein COA79_02090 [Planctomycetota bacterium]|nr:MAG: hypothetical protein COA79_02090 [Planctomycetota bacterium]